MTISNMWHFYVRGGKAYVPVVAQTDAGFFLDIDPVAVIPVDDHEALIRTIAQQIATGNPVVAAPERSAYGTPVVVRAAGVKTWATFEKNARCFTAYRTEAGYELPPMEKTTQGWVENMQKAKKLPPLSSSHEVAQELVQQAFA